MLCPNKARQNMSSDAYMPLTPWRVGSYPEFSTNVRAFLKRLLLILSAIMSIRGAQYEAHVVPS